MFKPKVIYEDDWMMVIDKPTGMVVNRAETVKTETLQDWIEKNCQFPIAKNRGWRNGIVHRLDKETSGVMVIAKTKKVLDELQSQFKSRQVSKTYLALVHGKVVPNEGWLTVPLARSGRDRKKFAVVLGGKTARTRYKVLQYFDALRSGDRVGASQGYSLVEVYPQTGRTHQIRVVFKHLGHPIAGDSKYLNKRMLADDLGWCPRLFLHAKRLEFIHPAKQRRVKFESELVADIGAVLKRLKSRVI